MDTRQKILSSEAAIAAAGERRRRGERIRLVTGYFDPLVASQAHRLGALAAPGCATFVAIREPERPLLEARARAELVAALAAVDYVVVGPLDGLAADDRYDERAADARRTEEFIAHVQGRHRQ